MKKDKTLYDHASIETKWQEKWVENKTYSPDLDRARAPYYNLMMFPYPSAEGLHVGNMYAFTGADIYARFNRMQQKDVFEPIGLDGFGIHSENYALKIGKHPMDQAKVSEVNFYRQLKAIGNSFDWTRTLATYDPEYYKWTQWIFTEMFKVGLAVRKKAPVNFCPSCKTVLSDEQVINGACERCGTTVEKRDLEQWFFKITDYAERLLNNISGLDWDEKVKVAQKNWIGKSEGARVKFVLKDETDYVLIHGNNGSSKKDFFPWLVSKLGDNVYAPDLPNTSEPNVDEQVEFILKNHEFDEKSVILAHSLGSAVAMKLIPKLKTKIKKLVLVVPPLKPEFKDGKKRETLEKASDWNFDFEAIKEKAGEIVVIEDLSDDIIKAEQPQKIAQSLSARLVRVEAPEPHFNSSEAKVLLLELSTGIEVFTTRPDTLYGATFLVLSPEHPVVKQLLKEKSIPEFEAVKKYVDEAKKKTERERLAEGKEKTGVFCGKYAVNPVNGEEIPVWIADYVLMGYGTGAIMAVPAHDARDFEFAKKFNLPIKQVIASVGPDTSHPRSTSSSVRSAQNSGSSSGGPRSVPPALRSELTEAYVGSGVLVNSDGWDGLEVPKDIDKVISDLEKRGIGTKETTFHLRDWLISRQRYWGPPIPMIYCLVCAEKGLSWFDTGEAIRTKNSKSEALSPKQFQNSNLKNSIRNSGLEIRNSSHDVRGWYPVEQDELPVELPYIEDYKPLGTGKSPLGSHPEFYETTCPSCGSKARRETDVSDTFLDSSWYFLRYLATEFDNIPFPSSAFSENPKSEALSPKQFQNSNLKNSIRNSKLEIRNYAQRADKWLPVNIYIGGAEHSVLHLLYARFIWKVFCDLGYVDFSAKGGPTSGWEEPFSRFFAHGLIIKNGAKMSKSKGNVIVPDEYIDKYGADTLRLYLMFLGPFKDGGDFLDSGIEGAYRFVKRIWNLFMNNIEITDTEEEEEVTRLLHKTIKEVTHDIEEFSYNTAIARLMEMYNFVSSEEKPKMSRETALSYLKLLAPFTPHMAEEIYKSLFKDAKDNKSIHLESWPKYLEKHLVEKEVIVVVQVNGKRRGELKVAVADKDNQELIDKQARIVSANYLKNQKVIKVVFVPGRIINFVV